MAMTAGLYSALFGNWQAWSQIGETAAEAVGNVTVFWWAVGLLNMVLLYVSSSEILLAVGMWNSLHPKLLMSGIFVLFLHVLLVIWDAKHGWALRHLWAVYGYILAIAIFAACVIALRKALKAGYLGKRLFGCAFCLWGIYVSSAVALYIKAPAITVPFPLVALCISVLIVPLASTAVAPLALASYRHA